MFPYEQTDESPQQPAVFPNRTIFKGVVPDGSDIKRFTFSPKIIGSLDCYVTFKKCTQILTFSVIGV